MLDEEERQDTQMREHFKEKWTPKPSGELTVNLRDECAKYRAIVENATHADKIVKEKYNTHREFMELLSKSDVSLVGVYFKPIINPRRNLVHILYRVYQKKTTTYRYFFCFIFLAVLKRVCN